MSTRLLWQVYPAMLDTFTPFAEITAYYVNFAHIFIKLGSDVAVTAVLNSMLLSFALKRTSFCLSAH